MRSVPEWIGKTDDTPVPDRVKLRVFDKRCGLCGYCLGTIMVGQPWDVDHNIAIENGGSNRESNLFPLHRECHRKKTKRDTAVKSKITAVRTKHLGLRKSKHPFQTNKDQPFKKKIGGAVVRRVRRTDLSTNPYLSINPPPIEQQTATGYLPWRDVVIVKDRFTISRMFVSHPVHIAALNNKTHMRFSEQRLTNHTLTTQEDAIKTSLASDHGDHPWALFYIRSSSPISRMLMGSMSLDIDLPNRRVDVGIMILPAFLGCGLAKEAWQAMINWLKAEPWVDKIEAGAMGANGAMIKIMRVTGMVFEGIRPSHFATDDKNVRDDVRYYGIVK